MNVANYVGCSTRTYILIIEEYDHYRMIKYLKRKEKDIWRFIEFGPNTPTGTTGDVMMLMHILWVQRVNIDSKSHISRS